MLAGPWESQPKMICGVKFLGHSCRALRGRRPSPPPFGSCTDPTRRRRACGLPAMAACVMAVIDARFSNFGGLTTIVWAAAIFTPFPPYLPTCVSTSVSPYQPPTFRFLSGLPQVSSGCSGRGALLFDVPYLVVSCGNLRPQAQGMSNASDHDMAWHRRSLVKRRCLLNLKENAMKAEDPYLVTRLSYKLFMV